MLPYPTFFLLCHVSLAQPNGYTSFSELKDSQRKQGSSRGGQHFPPLSPLYTPTPSTLSLPLRETPKPVKAGKHQGCGWPHACSLRCLTAGGKPPLVLLGHSTDGLYSGG